MNNQVNDFLENATKWKVELFVLRNIVLESGLTEDFKWRNPCYTFENKNILFIGGLKDACLVSFIKGALLNDPNKILIQQTEHSKSVRIIKFKSLAEIQSQKDQLIVFIKEAIDIETKGLKVEKNTSVEDEFCEELKEYLLADLDFKFAFENLTPGRKRGYNIFISSAKQSETRILRIEKNKARIFSGKGLHDCICGHSKKMPLCDGSHKYFS